MEKMQELVEKLNQASEAYYNGKEIMSNYEFDQMYEELASLEKETGIVLPDSPTKNVGAKVVDYLPKVKHEYPALSLDKTKDIKQFVGVFKNGVAASRDAGYGEDDKAVLMWKLDGSTVQATYKNGKLFMAATRGNGEIGSDVTHNVPYIKGLPAEIPYKGKLVVRGEVTMSYTEFNRINEKLPLEEKYKNPRNLANATIQLLDNREIWKREICFHAFNLIFMDDMPKTFKERLDFIKSQDIAIVDYDCMPVGFLGAYMDTWSNRVDSFDIPVDGLVVTLNNAAYADTLPGTGHNPNILRGYAFKWADETVVTVLREIEWSASRTGLLNPVAIFDPVELEGTTVRRASLHNVSRIKELQLKVGDRITVYKANKIIPQIEKNLTCHIDKLTYAESHPVVCPCCGAETSPVISEGGAEVVVCPNQKCPAKMIGKFTHFAERDCMNIVGLSEQTLERFIDQGFIRELSDIYHLNTYKDAIVSMDGLGEKSFDNIISAVEQSRKVEFVPFLHSLGIQMIGKGQAKLIRDYYRSNGVKDYLKKFIEDIRQQFDFTCIEGIGEAINGSIYTWAEENICGEETEFDRLLKEIEVISDTAEVKASGITGLTFVITGNVNQFANREVLKDYIESLGGKTAGSVSKNTSYLINNDVDSTSGKNKKAKELGIPIISEDEFKRIIGSGL